MGGRGAWIRLDVYRGSRCICKPPAFSLLLPPLFFSPRFSRKVWYERFEGLTLAEFVVSKTDSNICPINNRRKIANITKVHFLDVLKKMDFVTPVFFTELSSVFLSIEPNRRPSVRPSVRPSSERTTRVVF